MNIDSNGGLLVEDPVAFKEFQIMLQQRCQKFFNAEQMKTPFTEASMLQLELIVKRCIHEMGWTNFRCKVVVDSAACRTVKFVWSKIK